MTIAVRETAVPDSRFARWDARWKLAALLTASVGVATLRQPAPVCATLVCSLVMCAIAKLRYRHVRDRIALLLFGILPFIAILPFAISDDGPAWTIGFLRASERGLTQAAVLVARCLTIGLLAMILSRTAPIPQTLAAAHALYVPATLVLIAQLAFRYIGVLFEEARRLRIALWCRGFRAKTNRHTYHTLGSVAGALLVRGGERAERVSAAMHCRGFDGTPRVLQQFRSARNDLLGFLLVITGTAAIVLWDRL